MRLFTIYLHWLYSGTEWDAWRCLMLEESLAVSSWKGRRYMARPNTLTIQYIVLFSHLTVQLPVKEKITSSMTIKHVTHGCLSTCVYASKVFYGTVIFYRSHTPIHANGRHTQITLFRLIIITEHLSLWDMAYLHYTCDVTSCTNHQLCCPRSRSLLCVVLLHSFAW